MKKYNFYKGGDISMPIQTKKCPHCHSVMIAKRTVNERKLYFCEECPLCETVKDTADRLHPTHVEGGHSGPKKVNEKFK